MELIGRPEGGWHGLAVRQPSPSQSGSSLAPLGPMEGCTGAKWGKGRPSFASYRATTVAVESWQILGHRITMRSLSRQGVVLDLFPFYPDRSETTSHIHVVIIDGRLGLTQVPSNLFHRLWAGLCLAGGVLIGRSNQDLRQGSSQVASGTRGRTPRLRKYRGACRNGATHQRYHPWNSASDAIKAAFIGGISSPCLSTSRPPPSSYNCRKKEWLQVSYLDSSIKVFTKCLRCTPEFTTRRPFQLTDYTQLYVK